MSRINFAFLDAQHTYEALIKEYEFVKHRQIKGDIIVFDDVTPGVFDDIVKCVGFIEKSGEYQIQIIKSTQKRSYAIATKN